MNPTYYIATADGYYVWNWRKGCYERVQPKSWPPAWLGWDK